MSIISRTGVTRHDVYKPVNVEARQRAIATRERARVVPTYPSGLLGSGKAGYDRILNERREARNGGRIDARA